MSFRDGLLPSLLLATSAILSQPAVAYWQTPGPTNGGSQNIVIVVAENPNSNPERTCLAVTLAKTLAYNEYKPNNVTIFATLDGTALGLDKIVNKPGFSCPQSGGTEMSLEENLDEFLAGNQNNLVLCPICYTERFGGRVPDNGVLPGSDDGTPDTAVIDLLANADKVIDF